MQAKQNREFVHSFPCAGRSSAIPRKSGIHCVQWWLGRTNAGTANSSPPMSPYGLEYPVCEVGSAVVVGFPHFLFIPSLLSSGVRSEAEAEKALMPWKYCLAITKTSSFSYQHCHIQNSCMPATVRKINSMNSPCQKHHKLLMVQRVSMFCSSSYSYANLAWHRSKLINQKDHPALGSASGH